MTLQLAVYSIFVELEKALCVLVALEQVVEVAEERILEFRLKCPFVRAPERPRGVLLTLNAKRVLFSAWEQRLSSFLCSLSVQQQKTASSGLKASVTYPAHSISQRFVPCQPFASLTGSRRVGRQALAPRRSHLSLYVVDFPSCEGLQVAV